jgi:hypothetical protein
LGKRRENKLIFNNTLKSHVKQQYKKPGWSEFELSDLGALGRIFPENTRPTSNHHESWLTLTPENNKKLELFRIEFILSFKIWL